MKITRIIEYEGTPEWLEEQLGRSMPDGCRELPKGKISILTAGNKPMLAVYKEIEFNHLKVQDEIPS